MEIICPKCGEDSGNTYSGKDITGKRITACNKCSCDIIFSENLEEITFIKAEESIKIGKNYMKITATELSVVGIALNINDEGQRISHDLSDLSKAVAIQEKIEKLITEDGKMFIDGEIELSTEQKSFILKLLDRKWETIQGKAVLSLQEKLK